MKKELLIPLVALFIVILVLFIGRKSYTEDILVPEEVKVEVPLKYLIHRAYANSTSGLFESGFTAHSYLDIENTDVQPGTFVCNFTFKMLNRTLYSNDRVYIFPGQTITAHGEVKLNSGEDWKYEYTVTPSTKTATEIQQKQEKRVVSVPLYKWVIQSYR